MPIDFQNLSLLDISLIREKLISRFSAMEILNLQNLPLPSALNNLPQIAKKIVQAIKEQKK